MTHSEQETLARDLERAASLAVENWHAWDGCDAVAFMPGKGSPHPRAPNGLLAKGRTPRYRARRKGRSKRGFK